MLAFWSWGQNGPDVFMVVVAVKETVVCLLLLGGSRIFMGFLCGHCVLLDVFLCFLVYLLLVYWSLLILASV